MVGRKKWRLSCTPHCGSNRIERVLKIQFDKIGNYYKPKY